MLPTLALCCSFSKLENMRESCQHFTITLVSHWKPEGKIKWFLLVHVIFLESSVSPAGTITEIHMRWCSDDETSDVKIDGFVMWYHSPDLKVKNSWLRGQDNRRLLEENTLTVLFISKVKIYFSILKELMDNCNTPIQWKSRLIFFFFFYSTPVELFVSVRWPVFTFATMNWVVS